MNLPGSHLLSQITVSKSFHKFVSHYPFLSSSFYTSVKGWRLLGLATTNLVCTMFSQNKEITVLDKSSLRNTASLCDYKIGFKFIVSAEET